MQSVSSRIWTRVAVSISYDDNHYTTRTSNLIWGYKRVYTHPKGICSKVNVIALLDFELAYYDVTVQHISHYATESLPNVTYEVIDIM